MADKSYDAVVIGSGHNGFTVACYLQDAGLSTVVLEAYHEVGGGCSGLEAPLPGFLGNDCAGDVRFTYTPVYQDLELYNYGYKLVPNSGMTGTIFDDETAVVMYPPFVLADEKTSRLEMSRENIEKTMNEIARFSKRDAETYKYLVECWAKKWRDAYLEWRFNPPVPWGVLDPLERLVGDKECPIDQRFACMETIDIARELWDSDEMRLHFLTNCRSWGLPPNAMASIPYILYALLMAFDLMPAEVIKGGTHTLAHALQRRFSYSGGEFFVESEVDKVLVDNGKARGVRLVDGTEIEARKLVVSTLDLLQTLFRFIGEENLDRNLVRRIKNVHHMILSYPSPFLWGNIALHEVPKYKAESFNPDCVSMVRTHVTPKDIEWFYANAVGGFRTALPETPPSPLTWFHHTDSLWDRRAPDGKHILLIEQFGHLPRELSERGWLELEKEFPEMLRKEWQKYAPNMTRENLIGGHLWGGPHWEKKMKNWVNGWPGQPHFLSQLYRNRPLPELSQYRLPIEHYYLSGVATHDGVCVLGSPGYNCYKIIAEDFGLKKPWEEKGRPY